MSLRNSAERENLAEERASAKALGQSKWLCLKENKVSAAAAE